MKKIRNERDHNRDEPGARTEPDGLRRTGAAGDREGDSQTGRTKDRDGRNDQGKAKLRHRQKRRLLFMSVVRWQIPEFTGFRREAGWRTQYSWPAE